jgi:hypothetical protein
MAEVTLGGKLNGLKANEAAHNRWKLLASYRSGATARNAASRLRKRYRVPEWAFRTTTAMADGRYGLGVMYKRPDPDGRAPEADERGPAAQSPVALRAGRGPRGSR